MSGDHGSEPSEMDARVRRGVAAVVSSGWVRRPSRSLARPLLPLQSPVGSRVTSGGGSRAHDSPHAEALLHDPDRTSRAAHRRKQRPRTPTSESFPTRVTSRCSTIRSPSTHSFASTHPGPDGCSRPRMMADRRPFWTSTLNARARVFFELGDEIGALLPHQSMLRRVARPGATTLADGPRPLDPCAAASSGCRKEVHGACHGDEGDDRDRPTGSRVLRRPGSRS